MADAAVGKDKCGEQRLVSLPLSRIRVIMKSSPEVSSINQEALVLTAKATELFVQYLATCSYRHGSGKTKKALTYSDLASTAEDSETLQFLSDILPKKILANHLTRSLWVSAERDTKAAAPRPGSQRLHAGSAFRVMLLSQRTPMRNHGLRRLHISPPPAWPPDSRELAPPLPMVLALSPCKSGDGIHNSPFAVYERKSYPKHVRGKGKLDS
ncbi:chromatin accessibility complex 1 [Cricetulus griseus]